MEIAIALIAAAAALVGTLIGAVVTSRAARASSAVAREQVELEREAFESETRRSVTTMRHDLDELVIQQIWGPNFRRLDDDIARNEATEAWLYALGSEMRVLRMLTDKSESDRLGWDDPPRSLTAATLDQRAAHLPQVGVDLGGTLTYLDTALRRYTDLRPSPEDPLTEEHRARLWALCFDICPAASDACDLAGRDGQRVFTQLDGLRAARRRAEETMTEARRTRIDDLDPTRPDDETEPDGP